jgi:DNA invertase Pin-like site-specific DNA recombinase
LKSSVQYLNHAGALFFGLVGAASVLFASWTLVDPSMIENIGTTIGMALLLGTVTLSRFGGGRDDEGNDDDAGDDDDTTTEDNGPDWAGGTGVRYIRVSSLGQKDGHSLETQLDTLKDVANSHNIDLPFSHIRDEGRTGTNFDREGINEVLSLAKNGKIDTLLVVNLSRIGRKAPETIFFIYVLHEYCDVTVVTPSGPRRLNTSKELMTTTLQALIDHLSSMNRTIQAVKSTIRRFKDKNWSSAYKDNIPFGYKPDGEWITPVAQVEDAVQDLFKHYLSSGSYTATGEYMSNKYGMSSFEDDPGKVKRHLTRGVYVGKPRMNVGSDKVEEDEVVVDDPTLKIVDEDIYERVQAQTEQIAQKYSTNAAEDIDDFIETFGMLSVFESTPDLKLHCSECDSIMGKNGQAELSGKKSAQRYQCTNDDCGKEHKFPNELSHGAMKYLSEMISDEEEEDWVGAFQFLQ